MTPTIWKVENPISVQKYMEAVPKLTNNQRDILKNLYHIEPATDNTEIASKLGYKGMGGANLQIGKMGKHLCKFLNIEPDLTSYNPSINERGYFIIIHRQYGHYWNMEPNLRLALETLNIVEKADQEVFLETEISPKEKKLCPEGSLIQIWVSRYERNSQGVARALKTHGNKCLGCSTDFKLIYGDDIKDIVHVHHLYPFKDYGERKTNPETDLIPLCPNCHAVVHSTKHLMTLEELQNRISNR